MCAYTIIGLVILLIEHYLLEHYQFFQYYNNIIARYLNAAQEFSVGQDGKIKK